LAQTGERVTTLDDLAVVCANCHRMLHKRPWRTVPELRELLRSRRAAKQAE
jgi:5-methylcytosine-specific restriction protein A